MERMHTDVSHSTSVGDTPNTTKHTLGHAIIANASATLTAADVLIAIAYSEPDTEKDDETDIDTDSETYTECHRHTETIASIDHANASLVSDNVALDATPIPITVDWPLPCNNIWADELPIQTIRAESAAPNPHVDTLQTITPQVTATSAAVATATAEGLHLVRKNIASGYRNVYKKQGKYQARIERKGKRHHIGYFNVAEEAALCAARWLRDHPPDKKSDMISAYNGLPSPIPHALWSTGTHGVDDNYDDLHALVRDDIGEATSTVIRSSQPMTDTGTAEESYAAAECINITNLAQTSTQSHLMAMMSTLILFFANQVHALTLPPYFPLYLHYPLPHSHDYFSL